MSTKVHSVFRGRGRCSPRPHTARADQNNLGGLPQRNISARGRSPRSPAEHLEAECKDHRDGALAESPLQIMSRVRDREHRGRPRD
jgi:hypothetical protein